MTDVAETAKAKMKEVLESCKLGNKYIKASIDRAVLFSQAVERDASDASSRIRKAMRHYILAVEDRERTLLEKVDKFRQQKITALSDQMAGLRSALAGLAENSEMLVKGLEPGSNKTNLEMVHILTRGENQMEQFAQMYKNLQPREEFISFIPPNFEIVTEIRMQGEVVMVNQRLGNGNSVTPPIAPSAPLSLSNRRPIIRAVSTPPVQSRPNSAWDHNGASRLNLSTSPNNSIIASTSNQNPGTPNIGQSIPGYHRHITLNPAVTPSITFGFDGHENGQVSRPWGLCVDKEGNIVIADRRNNRIQVFFPDGTFKLIFGDKGTGNGQFDLPAGISTDPQNRIVVVDKDNHRVQVR